MRGKEAVIAMHIVQSIESVQDSRERDTKNGDTSDFFSYSIFPLLTTNPSNAEIAAQSRFSASGKTSERLL